MERFTAKGLLLFFNKIGIWFFLFLLFCSCVKNEKESNNCALERKKWEEKISNNNLSVDSLRFLLENDVYANDDVAIMVICKEVGERLRASSDFSDALTYHRQSLNAAYNINDTIGITQALNNIGIDFRRIGSLSEAYDYFYQALHITESFSGREDDENRENRAMAINGIGNLLMSFENYDEAENMFREALAEEKLLDNDLGQATNYANIGEIFEKKQQYDSAFFYYQRSMEYSELAKSQIEIGMNYIHFGKIYELQDKLEKAEREYQLAYEVMSGISDTWHYLEAALATARIRLMKNNDQEALSYINKARQAAETIHSLEHLSRAYYLSHEYNFKRGNYTTALNDLKKSESFEDSIQNVRKLSKVINMQLNYERDKHLQSITNLNLRSKMEARQKRIIIYASVISIVLLVFSLGALFYAYIQRTNSNKVLQNLNREQTNFFTNITHEFRTPLTVILGLNKQLQGKKEISPAEANTYFQAIDRQGNRLLKLVNHLLNISKIAGIDNLHWQKENIVIYIQMIVDSFLLYAKNKKIQLVYSSNEPVIIMDFIPPYIDNILQNLISNAIKFSQPGSKIYVIITKENQYVSLKVADSGKGIVKEDMDRIFDLFFQGDKVEKNNGSGIGLCYTRQMVEMMNGKIEVQSEENKGSVFTVRLPIKQSNVLKMNMVEQSDKVLPPEEKTLQGNEQLSDNLHEIAEPVKESHSKNNATVLLVEDNKDVLMLLKSFLTSRYHLVTARDGIEGLVLAIELVPDIIIADIMMPNKDGLTLCREIRESALLNHIPIILLTAKNTLDDRLKGLKHGADAYIGKPFQSDELLVQVDTLLQNRHLLKEKYMRSIFKNDGKPKKDVNMDFLQKATDIVYNEMNNPDFTTVTLAERLCVSCSQLNRKLNAISGYTPSGFITRLRIEQAKKKLMHENKTVGKIAEECGFYDMPYFSRTFKKFTQVSPSQYRHLPR